MDKGRGDGFSRHTRAANRLSFAKTAYVSKQLILASPGGKVISTC